MFAVGVASIIGESSSSFIAADIKTSVTSNEDVLGKIRLIPGSVQRLVGEDGQVSFYGVVVPGGVLHQDYLLGFAGLDEELG